MDELLQGGKTALNVAWGEKKFLGIRHPSRTNFGLRLVYRVGLGLGLVLIFV